MKTIPLTQGKVALVDDKDYNVLIQYKWYANQCHNNIWYPRRNISLKNGKRTSITMHQQICGRKNIDHINHEGLDNRRCNLRPCSHSQNLRNHRDYKNNSSKMRGVSWDKNSQKWTTYIYSNQERIYLGLFTDKNEAGRVVDQKAIELSGEFAVLNFPKE